MSHERWKHLDRGSAGGGGESAPRAEATIEPAHPHTQTPTHPAAFQHALALYRLNDFDACRELLDRFEPPFPLRFHRLLGLCAGRQGDYGTATPALEAALAEDPTDELLPPAILSARLAAGEVPDPQPEGRAALGELSGAACWRRGQELLAEGRFREAGRAFAEAGQQFGICSPPRAIGERLGTSCLGQGVAYLAADQVDAAQQAFSRARCRLPPEALSLARQVYELGEAIRSLSPAEKADAVAPLVELIRTARLRVRFYDGSHPVTLHWAHLAGLPGE